MNLDQLKSTIEAKRRAAIAAAEAEYATNMAAVERVEALADVIDPASDFPDRPPFSAPATERTAAPQPPRRIGTGRRVMIGNIAEPFTLEDAAEKLGVAIGTIRCALVPNHKTHMAGGWPVRWEGEPRPALPPIESEPERPAASFEATPRARSSRGPINPMRLPASEETNPIAAGARQHVLIA